MNFLCRFAMQTEKIMKVTNNDSPITRHLREWYQQNKREMPWRGTTDPYLIWVSEVILQQTRVAQGWDYYVRFTRRFPDVESLAAAEEEEVLKMWQGLGYYTRARNMHAAAKMIMKQFNGKFPTNHSDILSLKGVGDYTAAAISSIAFNKPYAAVDGNVLRVIARLFAIEDPIDSTKGRKTITRIAQTLLPDEDPGSFNQAIMDFGSTVCTPSLPNCSECPLSHTCMALAKNRVAHHPVTRKKNKVRKRYFSYFHVVHNGSTYISRRVKQDIWKNLYEFPLVETTGPVGIEGLVKNDDFATLFGTLPSLNIELADKFEHVLSHQVISAHFYKVIIPREATFETGGKFHRIDHAQLDNYPISRLISKYLESSSDSCG